MTVTLTELAELRLRTFVRGTPDYTPGRGIRLAVKDGGCNGYEYDIKIANAPAADDEVVESGSLRVFIDPKALPCSTASWWTTSTACWKAGLSLPTPTPPTPVAAASRSRRENARQQRCPVRR
jgi:iron-sulfur cluster assembly accessory protein